jgi:uncharacterized protein DUF5999
MCPHSPPCPGAHAPDREAARTVVSHPEQGWSLLCNGIVMFDDTGELLPGGETVVPHRPTDPWLGQVLHRSPDPRPPAAPHHAPAA